MGCITRIVTQGYLRLTLGIAFVFAMTLSARLPQAAASEDLSRANAPTTVVELPPVQQANCKRFANDDLIHDKCLRVKKILQVMSGEPRATAWADKMESFLTQWIESLEPDGFTFRNVECRLSWCIVEAGSTVGAGDRKGHGIVMATATAKENRIFQLENLFARDPDDAGIWDVVVIFKRYCTSTSELFGDDAHLTPDLYAVGQKC